MSMIYVNNIRELISSILSPDDNYGLRDRNVQKIICPKYGLTIEATKECDIDYNPVTDTIVESGQKYNRKKTVVNTQSKSTVDISTNTSRGDNVLKRSHPKYYDEFGDNIHSDSEVRKSENILSKKSSEIVNRSEYYWNNIQEPRKSSIHESGKCSRFNIVVDGIHIATIDPMKVSVHLPDPIDTYQTMTIACKLESGKIVCVKNNIKLLPFSRFITKQQCDHMNITSSVCNTLNYDNGLSSPGCGTEKIVDVKLNNDIRKYRLGTSFNTETIEGSFAIGFQSEWFSINIGNGSCDGYYNMDNIITNVDFSYLMGVQCSPKTTICLDAYVLPEYLENRTFIPQRCIPNFNEIPPGEFINYGISHISDETSVMAISFILEDKQTKDKSTIRTFSLLPSITRKTKVFRQYISCFLFSRTGQMKESQYLDPRRHERLSLCGLPISVVHEYQHLLSSKNLPKSSLYSDLYNGLHWDLFTKVIKNISKNCEVTIEHAKKKENGTKFYPVIDMNCLGTVLKLQERSITQTVSRLIRINVRGISVPNFIDLLRFEMKIYKPVLTLVNIDLNAPESQLDTHLATSCLFTFYNPLKMVTCKTCRSDDSSPKLDDDSQRSSNKSCGRICYCKRDQDDITN